MRHAVGKELLAWDESIDDEVEQRLDQQKEAARRGDIAEDEQKSEKEIEQEIYEDQDFWQFRWSDLKDALTEILQRRNPQGYWKARVRNFGWMSQDGRKYLQARTGSDFLNELLPQTDCHFRIFEYGRGLAIQNFHHDSPVGNEWYYVVPITQQKYEEW